MPAGGALLETIGEGQIIGAARGRKRRRRSPAAGHEAVSIQPVNDPQAAFAGSVRRVAREVNPETRLVGVFVTPDLSAHLMLNEYVRGVIDVASRQTLVAPPAAVLPEGDVNVLYTVENGRAVRHEVKVGLQNDRQVELVGPDLEAGQLVVVKGNSELEDGMAVEVEQAQ